MNGQLKIILFTYLLLSSIITVNITNGTNHVLSEIKIDGNGATYRFGSQIKALGDINNDGYSDFIIGTDYENTPINLLTRVYIYSGNLGSTIQLDITDALSIIVLNTSSSYSISNLFDLNGDNYDDFGIWQNNKIHIFFGRQLWLDVYSLDDADIIILNSVNTWKIHSTISSGLDFNSDGFTDLAILQINQIANSENNSVKIVPIFGGNEFNPLIDLSDFDGIDNIFTHNFVISEISIYDRIQLDFLILEDFRMDNTISLILAIKQKVYIFDITSNIQNNLGMNDSMHYIDMNNNPNILNFPLKILNLGDVNGDDLVDLMIYGTEKANYRGIQFILFGGFGITISSDKELSSDIVILGKSWAGIAEINRLGDINGDGTNDFVSSYPYPLNSQEIEIYIFYGNNFAKKNIEYKNASKRIIGLVGDGFGQSITGINDVDGDRIQDIIISAPASLGNQGAIIIKLSTADSIESNYEATQIFLIVLVLFIIVIIFEFRTKVFRGFVSKTVSTYTYNRSFQRKRKALVALMAITDNQQSIPIQRVVEILDLPEDRVEVIITQVLNENPMMGKYDKEKKIYIKGSKVEMYMDYLLNMMNKESIQISDDETDN